MLRPSFKLGDKFIPKPFIEYVPKDIDGFNPNCLQSRLQPIWRFFHFYS